MADPNEMVNNAAASTEQSIQTMAALTEIGGQRKLAESFNEMLMATYTSTEKVAGLAAR